MLRLFQQHTRLGRKQQQVVSHRGASVEQNAHSARGLQSKRVHEGAGCACNHNVLMMVRDAPGT